VSTVTSLAAAFNSKRDKKFNFNLNKNNVVSPAFLSCTLDFMCFLRQGLFGIPQLTEHSGFYLLQQGATLEADALVNEATSADRQRKLVRVFDQLSDCLCRVADMVRSLLPLSILLISS
jgi:intermediate peptidase